MTKINSPPKKKFDVDEEHIDELVLNGRPKVVTVLIAAWHRMQALFVYKRSSSKSKTKTKNMQLVIVCHVVCDMR